MVMHHSHDVNAYLDDSTRHVTRDDVILTADCLYWEGQFLDCDHNTKALNKVRGAVGRRYFLVQIQLTKLLFDIHNRISLFYLIDCPCKGTAWLNFQLP